MQASLRLVSEHRPVHGTGFVTHGLFVRVCLGGEELHT